MKGLGVVLEEFRLVARTSDRASDFVTIESAKRGGGAGMRQSRRQS